MIGVSEDMERYFYLFKNIGLLAMSQFATNFLSFFLVPLYTSVLTTAEYGTYDLFSATIGVLLPVLTMNIQEAILRFSLDKRSNKEAIVTVGIKYTFLSNLIFALCLLVNALLGISDVVREYSFLIFLLFFVQSLSGITTTYARGIEKIADLSASSILASATSISFNIIFLIVIKIGLNGYFLATIIGQFVQSLYLLIRTDILSHFRFKKYQTESKDMITYSRPLIANSIAWWINNSLDKYVIVLFCGVAENGIFSVAGKIPSIMNVFQSIFNQAWTISAVKDYDYEDSNGFFSKTYRAYNCMMVMICSGIIMFDKFLARILYAKEFFLGWKYVPWLTIAIVFGALSGFFSGLFAAVKDPKTISISTVAGAITNIALNIILTISIGAMGAAISTAVCYCEIWIIRLFHSKKYIKLEINLKRDVVSYALLVLQTVILISETKMYLVSPFTIFILLIILYLDDFKLVIGSIVKKDGE